MSAAADTSAARNTKPVSRLRFITPIYYQNLDYPRFTSVYTFRPEKPISLCETAWRLSDARAPPGADALRILCNLTAGHNREVGMRRVMRALVMVTSVLLVPAALYAQQAQATLAG